MVTARQKVYQKIYDAFSRMIFLDDAYVVTDEILLAEAAVMDAIKEHEDGGPLKAVWSAFQDWRRIVERPPCVVEKTKPKLQLVEAGTLFS